MSPKPRTAEKAVSAVDLIEQATSLLRSTPFATLAIYYIGTIPFITALIWFWADMSRSPDAAGRLAGSSLGLAILFVWMKVFHARFSIRLIAQLGGHRSLPPLGRTILIQGAVQPWAIIVLPLAALLTIPFGWCLAFFHNISSAGETDLKGAVARARELAMLWPLQNHILISLLALLGLVIFVNIAVVAIYLPYILKSLLGLEGIAATGGRLYQSSTFWFAVAAVTHLCIDPIIKASFAVRCHYGDALATGADLRALLRGMGRFAISFVLAASICLTSQPGALVSAAESPQVKGSAVQNLDRAMDRTLKDPRFAWRMPRDKAEKHKRELPGFIQAAVGWCSDAVKAVVSWIEKGIEWLFKKLFRPQLPEKPSAVTGIPFSDMALPLLYLLLGILLCAGAVYGWRHLGRRDGASDASGISPVTVQEPDISDDNITADELPEERWAAMARELLAKGETRLGLRAMYLAALASLGTARLITIARFKTNHDYERELRRFAHSMPDLFDAFTANLTIFEQTWYGMHLPDQAGVQLFMENHKRICSGVPA